MPLPYTHLAVAHACRAALAVPAADEYYSAALLPDIRYFTRQPREHYHFPLVRLRTCVQTGLMSPAFARGYAAHLALDEVWKDARLNQVYREAFPWFVRRRLGRRALELCLELYCLQTPVAVEVHWRANAFTEAQGADAAAVARADELIHQYLAQPAPATVLTLVQAAGLQSPENIQGLCAAVQRLNRPGPLRWFSYRCLNRATRALYPQVVRAVQAQVQLALD